MAIGGDESRRFPRLTARCTVRIQDRFGEWDAETEDIGPRGCRIVTRRPQTVGTLVSLTVRSADVADPLEVTGQIVWARWARFATAGVSFAGATPAPSALAPSAWFELLASAQRRASAPPDAGDAAGISIEVEAPEPEPEPLVARLLRRADELVDVGEPIAAELVFRRALALVPVEPALAPRVRWRSR